MRKELEILTGLGLVATGAIILVGTLVVLNIAGY